MTIAYFLESYTNLTCYTLVDALQHHKILVYDIHVFQGPLFYHRHVGRFRLCVGHVAQQTTEYLHRVYMQR